MNLFKGLTLAAAALFALAGSAHAQDKIRIATEGAYPPFNMKLASGELAGFDVDIAKALCEKMQADCEIVAQDWEGILPGLVAEKYDAIIASMSITEDRLKEIDFTDRYYSNYLRLVAKAGSPVTSIEDLKGKAVGAQRSTVAGIWAEDTLGRRSDVKLYDTQTAAYADLAAGRIEALVSDVYPAYDWIQQNDGYEFVGERIDVNDLIGIGIRKGDTELQEKFNQALDEIRKDGTYAEINAKYFPFDIY